MKHSSVTFEENPAKHIQQFIQTIVAESPENRLALIDGSPIFEAPLVGIADGDDPLFAKYKTIIGEFHMTPREVLEGTCSSPQNRAELADNEISVICWALPFSKRIRLSNAKRDSWPSLRWSHGTRYGEMFNDRLRQCVVDYLSQQGWVAVAPVLSPMWQRLEHLPGGHTSNWSERHALYAAGMGTFSLSDGFITRHGVAMRCGSVVVNQKLPITPREYHSHTENCPFMTDKSCGVCIDRCPADAITINGHDKVRCRRFRDEFFGYLAQQCGVDIEAGECGLCQTGVPCESKIPHRQPIDRGQ